MRTYGKNWKNNTPSSARDRAIRTDVEWDVRIDITDAFTLDDLMKNVGTILPDTDYIFISGVERPGSRKYDSKQNHVHIAVIFITPRKRFDVLKAFMGYADKTDQYAVPRNRRWTYAGWIIHHMKTQEKVDGVSIHFEKGVLPLDPFTEKTAKEVKNRLKAFGCDESRIRFNHYLDYLSVEDSCLS